MIAGGRARPRITHAVFDFDGTLSMLRAGWASVMLQQFLDTVPQRVGETDELRAATFQADIARTTGAPTVQQMQLLADRVVERGGTPRSAAEYKHDYARRLAAVVTERVASVESGAAPVDAWLVPGSRVLLETLEARGVALFVASGTDEPAVQREVALLGLANYFGPRVYGARDTEPEFDKRVVVERLLASAWIGGPELAVFGDGAVEVRVGKAVGALTVGVATDERAVGAAFMPPAVPAFTPPASVPSTPVPPSTPASPRIDPEKARALADAGADLIVPDYRCLPVILAALFGTG